MKRSNEGSSNSSNTKRSKASQACASCRRHKTRCELLDGFSQNGGLTCHRCKVLKISCSFESSSIIHLPPSASSNHSSESSGRTIVVHSNSNNNAEQSATYVPTPPPPPPVSQLACGPPISHTQLPSPPSSVSHPDPSMRPSSSAGINDPRELQPEDLVPDKVPWGPSGKGSFDWTAAPILAIQELASKMNPYPLPPMRIPLGVDKNLNSILSEHQICRLLEIFESRYAPWVCLPPQPSDSLSPLLDLIRCTVAARHLDPVTRASLSPRLQKLTEESFLSKLSTSPPSTESIHALLILALWSPLSDAGYSENRDAHSLAALAANQAMSLGLPELRDAAPRNSSEVADHTDKARLRLLLSAVESMTSLGTGRTAISSTTDADFRFIDPTVVCNIEKARDVRLAFISKVLSLVERGCKIRLQTPSNFENFFAQSQEILKIMGCIYSFMVPLPIISPYEQSFFNMSLLQFHGWRLLLSHHFMRELRTVMDGYNSQSWLCAEFKGIPVLMTIGQEAIESAMQVLSIALAQQDTGLLAAAPDSVFGLIAFAATWLIVSNFSLYQLKGIHLGWASEKLIEATVERLSHIAHSPEHTPARNAHLIMRLVHAWEERHRSRTAVGGPGRQEEEEERWDPWRAKESTLPRLSAERTTVGREGENEGTFEWQGGSTSTEQVHMQPTPPDYSSVDASLGTGTGTGAAGGSAGGGGNAGFFGAGFQQASDVLMDAEFWATFMENLNSDTSGSDSLLSSLTR